MKMQMKYTYRKNMMGCTCVDCGEEITGEGVYIMAHAGIWAEHTEYEKVLKAFHGGMTYEFDLTGSAGMVCTTAPLTVTEAYR